MVQNHTNQFCGTSPGDDPQYTNPEIFDIPGISTSEQSVYCNGVEQTETTDYEILYGDPDWPDSCDRINFVATPAQGAVVTIDFTGILRIYARFYGDHLAEELFMTNLEYCEVLLKGLLWQTVFQQA